jgi:division protein CdvB (Snf7/Vps24/ESCRT-III family)
MNSDGSDMDFLKRWEPKKEYSKNKQPLRPRLDEAIRIINIQMQKLDQKGGRIKEYDKGLFEKVVYYYRNRDVQRAKIYAQELIEVRKLAKLITMSKLALEQIAVRLSTVKEYGDVAANVAPALMAMKGIYGGITEMMPEADQSMSKLGDLLDGLMVDASQYSSGTSNPSFATEEGEKILDQAASMAEMRLSKSLPEIPKMAGEKAALQRRDAQRDGEKEKL